MKKQLGILLAGIMLVAGLAGCTSGSANEAEEAAQTSSDVSSQDNEEVSMDLSSTISVVSREDGSGTRGAFIELFGVEEKNDAGEKIDNTTEEALITNSTSVMMTTVSGNTYAIGYISLGSLNDSVKALEIDGVQATAENIKDGSYKIARPFNIATQPDASEVTNDFISFILSSDGQAIVEENGYIPMETTEAYSGSAPEGKIAIAGSSSVTPVMEKLKEAYLAVNANASIEIQQSDSTTGMTSVIDKICDIGMASRELKDSELESGIVPTVIAMDGIAVVVNNENTVDNLTSQQVKDIFTGNATVWSDVVE